MNNNNNENFEDSIVSGVGDGEGYLGGNFVTGVHASILKPSSIIYLTLEEYSLFIYLNSQKVDLFVYCFLNEYILSYHL